MKGKPFIKREPKEFDFETHETCPIRMGKPIRKYPSPYLNDESCEAH